MAWLASAFSSIHARCPQKVRRRDFGFLTKSCAEAKHITISSSSTGIILPVNFLHRPKKGRPYSITERRVPELIPVIGS